MEMEEGVCSVVRLSVWVCLGGPGTTLHTTGVWCWEEAGLLAG